MEKEINDSETVLCYPTDISFPESSLTAPAPLHPPITTPAEAPRLPTAQSHLVLRSVRLFTQYYQMPPQRSRLP